MSLSVPIRSFLRALTSHTFDLSHIALIIRTNIASALERLIGTAKLAQFSHGQVLGSLYHLYIRCQRFMSPIRPSWLEISRLKTAQKCEDNTSLSS